MEVPQKKNGDSRTRSAPALAKLLSSLPEPTSVMDGVSLESCYVAAILPAILPSEVTCCARFGAMHSILGGFRNKEIFDCLGRAQILVCQFLFLLATRSTQTWTFVTPLQPCRETMFMKRGACKIIECGETFNTHTRPPMLMSMEWRC